MFSRKKLLTLRRGGGALGGTGGAGATSASGATAFNGEAGVTSIVSGVADPSTYFF